jgi:outer membrane protein assembly complex protein YaeT
LVFDVLLSRKGKRLPETVAKLTRKLLIAPVLLCALAMPTIAQTLEQNRSVVPVSASPIADSDPIYMLRGLMVSEIAFRGLGSSMADAHLREIIQQKAGEKLDRAQVRSSIRTLYSTGRFSQLDVEADRRADGTVALLFVVKENYFVGTLTIVGRPRYGPSENQMANAAKLQLGELYSTEAARQGTHGISRVMEDYGFYGTQVSFEEVPHPETQQMDIIYRLVPGKIAKVGGIELRGDAGMTGPQLQRVAGMKPGLPARNTVVPRALQRLRKRYQKQKRLEAQVSVARNYQPATNSIDYVFEVDRGPIVDLQAEGASISSGQLRRYVPVFQENAVDDDLLNEGRRNLRDYMQVRGYFAADVQYKEKHDPEKDRLDITYNIERGDRHKLVSVVLTGNKYLHDSDLRPLMAIQTSSFLLSHGRFSQTLLARDVVAIKAMYVANGFPSVVVTPNVIEDYEHTLGQIAVVIKVDEGRQTRVNSLTIVGNDNVPTDRLLESALSMTEGQPFSDNNAGADRDNLLSYYFNRGFMRAEMEMSAKPHEGDATRMDVTYKITEGDRIFVDRVLVAGTDKTQPHVINREFDIRDGAPLSATAMLRTQSRLYDLGIFNSVDMAIQNPQGDSRYKNLLYNFREAKRWTFGYGLGFEFGTGANISQGTGPQGETGISPRLSFDMTRINFRGRDQSIILKSRYGRFVKRGQLSFDAPRWLDLARWRLTLSTFYDNSRDVNTFASERLEGAAQLEQEISRSTKLLYRLSYRRVKVDPSSFPAGFDPALKFLYSQPVRVGMPSFTLIRDRRDDPLNSTKGNYYTADIGVASSVLGSEANFSRVLVQNSAYYGFGKKKSFVFARSLRVGVETPYSNSFVPVPERFFVGGGNSHRGFAINQAGPRDPNTGGPVGGNAMVVSNLELRLPPTPLPFVQDNLSFILFHDMGNAFVSTTEMWRNLLQWTQKSPTNFSYISHAVGTGVRYRTPIGPVRVDIGYNLNPPVFQVQPASPSLATRTETLRRFNFFFSIGQTF